MDENTFKSLIDEMKFVEDKFPNRGGDYKKQYVMNSFKIIVVQKYGIEIWRKYEHIISDLIDFIIYLAHHPNLVKNLHKFKNKCLFCI